MTLKETAFEFSLPFNEVDYEQDACVCASARSVLPFLGANFDTDFLPDLQSRYSLSDNKPEIFHLLGVPVVASELGYKVIVHTKDRLTSDGLPSNASAKAKEIHPKVVADLLALEDQENLNLEEGALDIEQFQAKLLNKLSEGFYCLVILDWCKWNEEAQAKFGNPRHIIAIVGMNNGQVLTMDPSVSMEKQPFTQPIQKLFQALTEKQQLVFVGQVQDK